MNDTALVQVIGVRALDLDHTLAAIAIQEGRRPSKRDTLEVWCSCGERLTVSIPSQVRAALNLAERSHRIQIGWPDIEPWHGTPNGYVNRGCRCDPCTWAWASYRRGDDPVFPAPVWFDTWACTAGAL